MGEWKWHFPVRFASASVFQTFNYYAELKLPFWQYTEFEKYLLIYLFFFVSIDHFHSRDKFIAFESREAFY